MKVNETQIIWGQLFETFKHLEIPSFPIQDQVIRLFYASFSKHPDPDTQFSRLPVL